MLITDHIEHLRTSALSDTTITELMSCRSAVGAECATISPVLAQCDSVLVFPYPGNHGFCRYKLFPPIETPSGIMRYYQPPGSGNHLYVLPPVTAKLHDTAVPLFLVEGEKKDGSLVERGYTAAGIAGLWNWKEADTWDGIPELKEIPFVDREVVIVPDNDIWTQKRIDLQKAIYSLGKYLETCGAKVSVIVLAPSINKIGADDYFAAGHSTEDFDHLRRLRLNDLPLAQHKRWYAEWKELREAQPKGEGKKLPTFMSDTNPGTEAVNGTELLNAIVKLICLYVVVSTELVHSVALWILHAWALDAFDISPLLFITSATKRCGKSLLLEIVGALSPRPLVASNITGPTLFRVVDQYHPTVLVDEADTFIRENDELRGIINAGHRRSTAYVARTFGDNHEVKLFSTWAPKAIAAIDKIADTLEDRSVIVHMKRRAPSEKIQRFRSAECIALADPLRSRAARWAQDNIDTLRRSKPEVPEELNDRAANNWEPLFAIADLVGDEWRQRARTAALMLSGGTEESDDSVLVDLLKEFHKIFNSYDRISSADLVKRLSDNPEGRWVEYGQARKPITQRQVAIILSPIKIRPNSIKLHSGGTVKGYVREWFIDAFSRYIPENGGPIRNQRNQHENKEEFHDTDPEPDGPSSGSKTRKNNNGIDDVPEVPDRDTVSDRINTFSAISTKQADRCITCHIRMGLQARIDGGFDYLCPRCGKSHEAVVTQEDLLPSCLDRFPVSIDVIDAEFHAPAGHNPRHHCVANHELRSDAATCTLREDFAKCPPYGTSAESLMVAFAGTQDLTGLLEVDLPLPENYIDAATETKLQLNVPRLRKVPSLIESCDHFKIPHEITVEQKKKEARRFNKAELSDDDRREMRAYCPNDCKLTSALFLKLLSNIDIDRALRFGEYIKENARIACRGIPIDIALFDKIQRNREQIRLDIIRRSPIGFEIYADDGTRNKEKVETWIRKNGFEGWELTPKSGDPCLQENYLKKLVAGLSDENPEAANTIQRLIDLFADLHDFDSPPFGVAPDGRTHADQRPFGASSGRNTPKHYVLNARKWWRWLIHSVKGSAIINFDFASEEPAIAAYLSGDQAMISAYEAGDMYQPVINALGVSRKSAKACVLGVMYGRGAKALAEDEGVPYAEAERILRYHRDTYRAYWAWSDSVLETVKSKGVYELPDGWALRIDDSFKDSHEEQRTIRNFPIQGLGGCILRATVLAAAKENLSIIGTHHDSIVTESPLSKIDDQVKRMSQIMWETSAKFLNGKEIRVKPTVYEGRFEDADGAEDWQRISKLLKKYS